MIELAEYRIVVKQPSYPQVDGRPQYDQQRAKLAERVEAIKAFINDQAQAYKDAGKDPYMQISNDRDDAAVLKLRSTTAFQKLLEDANHSEIEAVEEPCGVQFLVCATFVPAPHSPMNFTSLPSAMLRQEFQRVSYSGIAPGNALTQGEKDARLAMNDTLFGKLAKGAEALKQQNPNCVIEMQERQIGSIFVRITPKDLQKPLSEYTVISAMRSALSDKENVGAVLNGPALYPSEIARMRAAEQKPATPEPRKPNKLDL